MSNIDALTAAELKEQLDALEVEYNAKAGAETLRKKLKDALGEDDNSDTAPVAAKSDMVEINFSKDKDNKQPIFIGVNGKSYRIRRGEWVPIPRILLPTIENIKKDIMDPETREIQTIQPYPYQVREVA